MPIKRLIILVFVAIQSISLYSQKENCAIIKASQDLVDRYSSFLKNLNKSYSPLEREHIIENSYSGSNRIFYARDIQVFGRNLDRIIDLVSNEKKIGAYYSKVSSYTEKGNNYKVEICFSSEFGGNGANVQQVMMAEVSKNNGFTARITQIEIKKFPKGKLECITEQPNIIAKTSTKPSKIIRDTIFMKQIEYLEADTSFAFMLRSQIEMLKKDTATYRSQLGKIEGFTDSLTSALSEQKKDIDKTVEEKAKIESSYNRVVYENIMLQKKIESIEIANDAYKNETNWRIKNADAKTESISQEVKVLKTENQSIRINSINTYKKYWFERRKYEQTIFIGVNLNLVSPYKKSVQGNLIQSAFSYQTLTDFGISIYSHMWKYLPVGIFLSSVSQNHIETPQNFIDLNTLSSVNQTLETQGADKIVFKNKERYFDMFTIGLNIHIWKPFYVLAGLSAERAKEWDVYTGNGYNYLSPNYFNGFAIGSPQKIITGEPVIGFAIVEPLFRIKSIGLGVQIEGGYDFRYDNYFLNTGACISIRASKKLPKQKGYYNTEK